MHRLKFICAKYEYHARRTFQVIDIFMGGIFFGSPCITTTMPQITTTWINKANCGIEILRLGLTTLFKGKKIVTFYRGILKKYIYVLLLQSFNVDTKTATTPQTTTTMINTAKCGFEV